MLVSDTSGLFIFKFNKPTGIKNEDGRLSSFKLFQNYPNPFNPTTKLSFEIGHQSFVSLKVYDLIGNEIAVLVNEEKPSGNYNFEFKPGNLTSGVYFCELRAGEKIQTIKMLYLK
ncbi:MAG: T9SS C-terminal target domain-containing protein [Ignavibacteriales bacterium]|nr:MAG: T9SS C-terminal target domain-containing protein [Ignavibacteriales bacterium]